MLFKVFMTESFADSSDRCGVLEADSLEQATQKLRTWFDENFVEGEDFKPSGVQVLMEGNFADVAFPLRDSDGFLGRDSYRIQPVRADILMFLAEDWNLIFY